VIPLTPTPSYLTLIADTLVVATAIVPTLVVITTALRILIKLQRRSRSGSTKIGWDDYFVVLGCILMFTNIGIVWSHSVLADGPPASMAWFYATVVIGFLQIWCVLLQLPPIQLRLTSGI
jgi:hypothetical protein